MFKNPFSFNGRIRRLEYGLSTIIGCSCLGTLLILFNLSSGVSGPDSGNLIVYIILLCVIPLYWFAFAQGAKRCHDLGNSGWFQLIPLYGFWLLFADSENGVNRFGPNPKGEGNVDEIDQIGGYIQA